MKLSLKKYFPNISNHFIWFCLHLYRSFSYLASVYYFYLLTRPTYTECFMNHTQIRKFKYSSIYKNILVVYLSRIKDKIVITLQMDFKLDWFTLINKVLVLSYFNNIKTEWFGFLLLAGRLIRIRNESTDIWHQNSVVMFIFDT